MDSSTIPAVIARHKEKFREAVTAWQLNKKDPESPLIDSEVQKRLLDGFQKIIGGLNRAERLQDPHREFSGITRAVPALMLENELKHCTQVKAYGGNKTEAAWYLLGGTIKAAVDAAFEAGIVTDKERMYIQYKYFDKPYMPAQDPFDLV